MYWTVTSMGLTLNLNVALFSLASFLIPLYSRLGSLPEAPVAIDWSYYKKAVANAGMVDEFEKKVIFITWDNFIKQKQDSITFLNSWGKKYVVQFSHASTLFPWNIRSTILQWCECLDNQISINL